MLSAYFNIHSDFPFRNANKFQLELFQVLKDDAVKVLHSICQQIWKTQQWPKTGKDQFSFQPQRKAMPKDVQITVQLHSFHMLAKLCSKILQARLQQYVNQELPDVQRQRNQRSNCQCLLNHRKSKGIPEKYLFLFHWLH